jgi:hypothetical protein
MFSVAVTYLGTAMAGHLVQASPQDMNSVYNRLKGMNTTTNPEDLVIKTYHKIINVKLPSYTFFPLGSNYEHRY